MDDNWKAREPGKSPTAPKIALRLGFRKQVMAKRQGLPVETVGSYSLNEGASVVPIIGSTAPMNRAPHPMRLKSS